MKKCLALILSILVSGMFAVSYAATKPVSSQVYSGIAKYKAANYTGCLQDMEAALKKNPNDVLAKYYTALVYTKIGMKKEAKEFYQKVVDQNSDRVLATYSKKALTCLDNPEGEGCKAKVDDETDDDEMSAFIRSKNFIAPELRKKIQERELNDIKNSFNSNKVPDLNEYRFLNDASGASPSDAQIAAAVKVLAQVGYNPAAQIYSNPYNMLGGMNQNNNFMNMLPYIMAQNNATKGSNVSPELIQAMLMNQAMGGLDFGSNN